jgi:predicted NBD/HSP70 family sugar kinase
MTGRIGSEGAIGVRAESRGTNQAGVRAYNERLVLSLIRRHGQIAKAEIARLTGLSAQTVSVIVKELEADGLLKRESKVRGRIGQPSIPFSLDPHGAFGIGLKIGRRSADVVLLDFLGEVRASRRLTYRYPTPFALERFAIESVAAVLDSLDGDSRSRVGGIGIAQPFEIWSWAEETGAPAEELAFWRDADLVAALAARFDLSVYALNDITAACGAELVFGEGAKFQDFLYLYVGAFIGGGVVLGGALFPGRTGNAGALGSLLVPDGKGGAVQLIRRASLYLLEAALRDAGADPEGLWRSTEVWQGPRAVIDAWHEATAEALAIAIVAASAVIDFEAAIIDGAMPESERKRLIEAVGRALLKLDRQGLSPLVLAPGTLGSFARAMGGAALPLMAKFTADREVLFKEPSA